MTVHNSSLVTIGYTNTGTVSLASGEISVGQVDVPAPQFPDLPPTIDGFDAGVGALPDPGMGGSTSPGGMSGPAGSSSGTGGGAPSPNGSSSGGNGGGALSPDGSGGGGSGNSNGRSGGALNSDGSSGGHSGGAVAGGAQSGPGGPTVVGVGSGTGVSSDPGFTIDTGANGSFLDDSGFTVHDGPNGDFLPDPGFGRRSGPASGWSDIPRPVRGFQSSDLERQGPADQGFFGPARGGWSGPAYFGGEEPPAASYSNRISDGFFGLLGSGGETKDWNGTASQNGILAIPNTGSYHGPDAADEIMQQKGPFFIGAGKLYGPDGGKSAVEQMGQAGRYILGMSAAAGISIAGAPLGVVDGVIVAGYAGKAAAQAAEGNWRGARGTGIEGLIVVGGGRLLEMGGKVGDELVGGTGDCPWWGNCFPAGTVVAVEGGRKPIDRLTAEDRVWAFDFVRNVWRLCAVQATHENGYDGNIVTIRVGAKKSRRRRATRSGWCVASNWRRGPIRNMRQRWSSAASKKAAGCRRRTCALATQCCCAPARR